MGYDMQWAEDTRTDAEKGEQEARRQAFRDACERRNALGLDGSTFHEQGRDIPGKWIERQVEGEWIAGEPEWVEAQAEVITASRLAYEAELTYYRLNIWGMSKTRAAMSRLNMLDEDRPSIEWPDYDSFEAEDAYDAALAVQVAKVSTNVVGIGLWKLGSNDGWHVTVEEIRAALAQYDLGVEMEPSRVAEHTATLSWWDGWITWLRSAADRGNGFKVW